MGHRAFVFKGRIDKGNVCMLSLRILCLAGFMAPVLPGPLGQAQQAPNAPLPDIRELIHQVQDHQKQLEKVRENYTYSSQQTVQDLDSNGRVKKTEVEERDVFYANGQPIGRLVKKDGQPLDADADRKETERVTKLVEKAEKLQPGQSLYGGEAITVGQVLEMMDVRNERRETFRGRPTIVFDFIGRKDAKTHGLAQDVSKTLRGTLWVDEGDRQLTHMEVSFIDNFNVGGGLVARFDKGTSFSFDQALVNGEVWLPTGGEGTVQARILLLKGLRQHFSEHDYDYKRFHVEAQPGKDVKTVAASKP
jgi:hypothetical protein